jgi:hypothetical protein
LCDTHYAKQQIYVEVADVGQATASARLLGASVLLEPHEDPPAGAAWRPRAGTAR